MEYLEKFDSAIEKTFDSGDKEIRTWFLVKSNTLPFVLCGGYALFVTGLGPALMKGRKPFTLRGPMIAFNAFLVLSYTITLLTIFINLPTLGYRKLCYGVDVEKGDVSYLLTRSCWVLYLLKYIEFIDTLFFILRKKFHLVTFLHVIHHTLVPLLGWVMLRTETSGFQSIPVLVNGVVHVIMYSYYGLAAVGPHMKKYLWWKKYLTILQMVQFVFIVFFVSVIAPLTGCKIVKTSIWMDYFGGFLFFMLFFNFYQNSFQKKKDV